MHAAGHFIEVRGLAIKQLTTEVAFDVHAKFIFGHELRFAIERFDEKMFGLHALRQGEPQRARLRCRAFIFDASSPCFATDFALRIGRPGKFQSSKGDAGLTEIALLTIGRLRIGIAKAVSA